MTISEKIFLLIEEKGMTQKEFAEKTGISQSSISDWKRKKTNPVSEKILIICDVLNVTPYELLSGTDGVGKRSAPANLMVIDKNTELGNFILEYQKLDESNKNRLLGYFTALKNIEKS